LIFLEKILKIHAVPAQEETRLLKEFKTINGSGKTEKHENTVYVDGAYS
jgi:hypothetical protein